jgi:hypothetical protein
LDPLKLFMAPMTVWLELMSASVGAARKWTDSIVETNTTTTTTTGLINIINGTASSDPATESKIVEDGASYGRQLGRINDVVAILARHLQQKPAAAALTQGEQDAMEDFRTMLRDIAAVKYRARPELAVADVLRRYLDTHQPVLGRRDPKAHNGRAPTAVTDDTY